MFARTKALVLAGVLAGTGVTLHGLARVTWAQEASAGKVSEQTVGHPSPSPYPISWELEFEPGIPRRVTIQLPGEATPRAFWYLTYTVTNKTKQEQTFLPVIEMLSENGTLVRSDFRVPLAVFQLIKGAEKKQFLEQQHEIGGEIRLGVDEARDGVAIWAEPTREMGRFSIFVQGLSGETARVKDANGKEVILRKSLQLNYFVRGDDVFPGEDEVNVDARAVVMR
jgi:hypothetical protein